MNMNLITTIMTKINNPDEYYQRSEVSNSDLTELKNLLHPHMQFGDKEAAFRFGSIVDAIITNFHLPQSTLIMLVSALAGREHVLAAYEEAVREKYRFFSFGDAMFIY